MDVKANLAEICAGGLSVSLLPSAPFSWQHHRAPASLGMGDKGSAGRQLDPHQEEPDGAEDVLTPVGMEN